MNKQGTVKTSIITPSSVRNFSTPEVKKAFEKIEKLNKVISEQSKIDQKKLSVCISI